MCGIIGCVIKNPEYIKKDLYLIYENQKRRGQNGFGYAISNSSSFKRFRTKVFPEIKDKIEKENFNEGDIFLFHHRLPTSTSNGIKYNHPIMNRDHNIMIIHNGIINDSIKNFPSYKFETKDYSIGKITDSEFLIPTFQNFLNEGQDFDLALKNITEKYLFSAFFLIRKGNQKLYFGSNNQDLASFNLHENLWMSSEYPFKIKGTSLINTCGWIDINGKIDIKNLDLDNDFFNYQYGYSLDYWRCNKAKKEKREIKYDTEINDENERENEKIELWKKYKYDLW